MDDRDYYFLLRKKKKIRLKEIAQELGCSIALISFYENEKCNMSDDKILKYQRIIQGR